MPGDSSLRCVGFVLWIGYGGGGGKGPGGAGRRELVLVSGSLEA